MLKRFLFILILLSLNNLIKAQISHGGEPLSFKHNQLKRISSFYTPEIDYQKLIDEDENKQSKAKPFRFGKTHEVNLTPENSGVWNITSNGEKIWQLRIQSKNAYSVALIFNKFKLQKGAKLFIYSPDKKNVIGSFIDENNNQTGWFSTIPLSGDEIIVELDVPANQGYGELNISGIVHDYKNAFGLKTGFGASGKCNVNINCDAGLDWQNEKRSVVKYSYSLGGFNYYCTGALVNNTSFNGTPYLLTAEHCISSQTTANTAVFMFNYESENCNATVNPTYQSLSSATLKATGGNLDFTLLELNEAPPINYNVYYAGWNRRANVPTNTTTIHHPQGDIKKISKDLDAPVIGDYGSGYLTNSHWNIVEWDLGTTEGGSSGSPLFDENHRIVGDLTGGDASCSYDFNDYYARIDISWDYHSSPTSQLKAWLDPTNTGTEILEGFDPNLIVDGVDIGIIQVKSPIDTYCANEEIVPEVIIQNKGSVDLTSAVINYKLNNGNTVSKVWSGILKPYETTDFKFNIILAASGDFNFKAFTSSPNGIDDINNYNDTLKSKFIGEAPLVADNIIGPSEICAKSLSGNYSISTSGNYLWTAEGGTIQGYDSLQTVSVEWNEWGERYLNLTISNLCNSVNAEPLKIDIIEQSIELEIVTGNNSETSCWKLMDCDDNILYEKCGLEAYTTYTENFCLHQGCFHFYLYSENDGINHYSLINQTNGVVLSEGKTINGSVNEAFDLNASVSLVSYNIYPNPSQNELVIEGSFMELYADSKYTISNLRGAIVIPSAPLSQRETIDISSLPRGVYLIEIVSSYGKYSKKFVKP